MARGENKPLPGQVSESLRRAGCLGRVAVPALAVTAGLMAAVWRRL